MLLIRLGGNEIQDGGRPLYPEAHNRFHTMYFHILTHIIRQVDSASKPEWVVASPYDGIKKGRAVIMSIPNPKPVVRSTKLAPTASNAIRRYSVI